MIIIVESGLNTSTFVMAIYHSSKGKTIWRFSYICLRAFSNDDSTEGIPEGFFDDPKLDAKVSRT